jgi:hypothetical protein
LVTRPSIFTMRSPVCSPARYAGVPSMGDTTVRTSSRSVISIPRPPQRRPRKWRSRRKPSGRLPGDAP